MPTEEDVMEFLKTLTFRLGLGLFASLVVCTLLFLSGNSVHPVLVFLTLVLGYCLAVYLLLNVLVFIKAGRTPGKADELGAFFLTVESLCLPLLFWSALVNEVKQH